MKIAMDLAPITACDATDCAYNLSEQCHAGAITVGDGTTPLCDTFFEHGTHPKDGPMHSGVGPCKVSGCRHNRALTCGAVTVSVGESAGNVKCLSFEP
jgi:hypothetical protein